MEKPGRLTPLVDSLVANALTIEKERLTPVIDNLVENALDSGRISMMELDSAIQNEKEQLNTLTVQISHNSLTISENQGTFSMHKNNSSVLGRAKNHLRPIWAYFEFPFGPVTFTKNDIQIIIKE